MRTLVLVYLPTKLGDFWGKCRSIFQHHGEYGNAKFQWLLENMGQLAGKFNSFFKRELPPL
jgi:hypothetical protein